MISDFDKIIKGGSAEDRAVQYLTDNSFEIIKRNFHFGKVGEIDIIAKKCNILVFVEVRSRFSPLAPDPLYSIKRDKQNKLRRTAKAYLHINNLHNQECRFDVIIVEVFDGVVNINHLENAF